MDVRPAGTEGLPADAHPRRALVCALDWGLGHATRTTPLVRSLQDRRSEVVLASNGRAAAFWRSEFPDLELRELPDYGVRYAPGPWLVPTLLASFPRLLGAIRAERGLVRRWAGEFDLVVSDNRYGCAIPGVRSVLLTHQLRLAAPRRLSWMEPFGERLMARLCRPFGEVWIPDRPSGRILSGRLGHPSRPDRFPTLQYVGPLSRLSAVDPDPAWSGPWDVVAVASGPEPSRTSFEDALRHALVQRPGRHLLVRGRPDQISAPLADGTGLVEVPHLSGGALRAALQGAGTIVSRGGYSTVMDLDALGLLGERCVFVPTPGQTEQESLAADLSARGLCRNCREDELGRLPT
jgi:hypothetical protein